MRTLWIVVSLLALAGSVAWFISTPGWEPAVVALGSLASLVGYWLTRNSNRRDGVGGSAIVAGENTEVNVSNTGTVSGGVGGTGGDGGHAIRVGPGVTLNIVNAGVIAGGDAGNKPNKDA